MPASELESALIGQYCERLEILEFETGGADWYFFFSGGAKLRSSCPWRLMSNEQITFGSLDHKHQFGLPSPVDGVARTIEAIARRPITKIVIAEDSSDLVITFDGGVRVELFNNSCGYEGWEITVPKEQGVFNVIALGGGELAIIG